MSKKSRSIGYHMQRCKTREQQLETARIWRQDWREEHIAIVDELKDAIDNNDKDKMRMLFAEMRTLTEHKHQALDRIFDYLTTPLQGG